MRSLRGTIQRVINVAASRQQTDSQVRLKTACDRLFNDRFSVPTVEKTGQVWALTDNGYNVFIEARPNGHYWCFALSPNSKRYDGQYHTNPDSQNSVRTVPPAILEVFEAALPMPTYNVWGVLDDKHEAEAVLLLQKSNDSKDQRPSAPLFVVRDAASGLSRQLYRHNCFQITTFWDCVNNGYLVPLGNRYLNSGYIALGPRRKVCLVVRGRILARPEDWPSLRSKLRIVDLKLHKHFTPSR